MNLEYALHRIRDVRQELVHVAVDLTDVLDFLTEAAKAARCTSCEGYGKINPGVPCPDCGGNGFRPCWDPHRT